MKKLFFLLILSMFGLLSLTSCSISQYSETSSNVFDSKTIKGINVQSANGNVEIKTWEGEEIKVDITKTVKGIENLESEIRKIEVSFEQNNDELLNCVIKMPKSSNFLMSYTVDVIVRVPRKMFENINVKISNGRINVESVNANFNLETSNGKIDLYQSLGTFKLKTSNGDIRVKGLQILRGDNVIESSNGDIVGSLKVPESGSLILSTRNGNVDVELLGSLKVDLEITTKNGKIDVGNLNLTIEKQEKKYIRGKINGGGFRLSIFSSNGSVTVRGIPAISV